MHKRIFDFNKEIIFGELGALISAPIAAFIASQFTKTASFISAIAVLGSLAGASLFWVAMRAIDEKKRHELSHLASDIGYFTPAAFLTTLLFYYPTLFLLSRHLINQDYRIMSSVVLSQILAFSMFLIVINLYHYYLLKIAKVDL
jgi:beta-lactamase regulating signal transducer with metallopeptidase domain